MSAAADTLVPLHPPASIQWLRRELADFPGRGAMTLRLVIAVVATVVISMTLQTPLTAFSAYMVFFVTQKNRVVTTIIAIALVAGATVAVAASLLLSIVTIDASWLRLPAMAAIVCGAMYLSRATVIGPLFFAIGFVLSLTQSLTEAIPDAEHLVRGFLWLWVIIVFPMPIVVIVNRLVLTADPWKFLQRSLQRRLGSAAAALRRALGPDATGRRDGGAPPGDPLLDEATRGSAALFEQLKHATLIHPDVNRRQASLTAAIVASERLLAAAAALRQRDGESLSGKDRLRAEALADRLSSLEAAWPEPGTAPGGRPPSDDAATLPELRDLQRAAGDLSDGLARRDDTGLPPAAADGRKGLFVPDAFTNPDYLRFGLKVSIATMSCYVIYTALDWPGIRTAFITCCFIALESNGALTRKAALRLGGCAVGGLLGFLSILYLIPRMESIVSLALLTAAGAAIGGWVAAGTERIAYAGLQIALAFFMCIFQGFAPDTQFHTIRDRVVGIVLGIVVSSVVFRLLWPVRASDRLGAALGRVLRAQSRLALVPAVGAPLAQEAQRAETLRRAIGNDLGVAAGLAELAAFEGEPDDAPGRPSTAALTGLMERAQAVSLSASALAGDAGLEEWTHLDTPAQSAETALRAAIAGRLAAAADLAEGKRRAEPAELDASLGDWKRAVAGAAGNGRVRLVDRLVRQARLAGATVGG